MIAGFAQALRHNLSSLKRFCRRRPSAYVRGGRVHAVPTQRGVVNGGNTNLTHNSSTCRSSTCQYTKIIILLRELFLTRDAFDVLLTHRLLLLLVLQGGVRLRLEGTRSYSHAAGSSLPAKQVAPPKKEYRQHHASLSPRPWPPTRQGGGSAKRGSP